MDEIPLIINLYLNTYVTWDPMDVVVTRGYFNFNFV